MLSEERIEEIATEVASPVSRYLPYWRTAAEFARAIEAECSKMVGELELEVTALKEVSDHHLRDVTNLCGHIAASEQRIKELEIENIEQARLLGMSAEREADLRGEVERLTAALKKAREALDDCRGNINTERSFADELEHGVGEAIATINEVLKK